MFRNEIPAGVRICPVIGASRHIALRQLEMAMLSRRESGFMKRVGRTKD
jgi:hypothetical protein